MTDSKRCAIGIDLGGTKINIAAVDLYGNILDNRIIPTDVLSGPEKILKEISKHVNELSMNEKPIGLGIGVPGQINREAGVVNSAPNLKWCRVPVVSQLSSLCNLDVYMTGDVHAATIGEWRFGAGKNISDFVCLFIGTGIGGGVVSQNVLLQGSTGIAGELGHLTVNVQGNKCSCGHLGCLEAYAGGWAIAKSAKEAIQNDPIMGKYLLEKIQNNQGIIDAKLVADAAKRGDLTSIMVIEKAIEAIQSASVSIVNIFNPTRLIIGGGLTHGFTNLIPKIQRQIDLYAIGGIDAPVEVIPAVLENNAGVIGAATLVFDFFEKKELH